ncbi:MAG: hypothetical protein AAFX93_17170 [Verrucomicrobiota bacterium]
MTHADFAALRASISGAGDRVISALKYRQEREREKQDRVAQALLEERLRGDTERRHQEKMAHSEKLARLRTPELNQQVLATIRKNLPNDGGTATYKVPVSNLEELLQQSEPKLDPLVQAEQAGLQQEAMKLQGHIAEGNEYPGLDWWGKMRGNESNQDKLALIQQRLKELQPTSQPQTSVPPQSIAPTSATESIPLIQTQEAFDALPSGARYREEANGQIFEKP